MDKRYSISIIDMNRPKLRYHNIETPEIVLRKYIRDMEEYCDELEKSVSNLWHIAYDK